DGPGALVGGHVERPAAAFAYPGRLERAQQIPGRAGEDRAAAGRGIEHPQREDLVGRPSRDERCERVGHEQIGEVTRRVESTRLLTGQTRRAGQYVLVDGTEVLDTQVGERDARAPSTARLR